MNRTIQIVTEKLTDLLPDNQQNYKPEELRSWGFPNFIVNRIQIELERNLSESMRLPQTDWANMQSAEVQNVWEQFIIAIRNEAWLPASYARTVIETAVADVLEMLVEPRKNITQIVFGSDDELSLEQLNERLKILVVYRHFARLLPRYMEKKGLEVLTRERCAEIIKKADEKVTSRYTPLNWAQMLEPLFKLLNEQIDSSLLRLFFEDKKMPRIARKFDFMEKSVNRAVLIETLSSPESLNMDGFEEDQSDLFGSSESDEENSTETNGKEFSQEERTTEEQDKFEADHGEHENGDKPENINKPDTQEEKSVEGHESGQVSDLEEGIEKESGNDTGEQEESPTPLTNKSRESNIEFEHEETSLNTIFANDEDDAGGESGKAGFDKDQELNEESEYSGGLNDAFEEEEITNEEDANNEEEVKEIKEEEPQNGINESSNDEDSNLEITAEQKEETPMWQRFMSSEELDQLAEEDKESSYENEFIEEPIFDLNMEKEPSEEEIAALRKVLQDEQDYFVQKIFGGSERAYDEALEKIASKKGWRDASRFIEKEIFKRNMIDMYSEEAVEFTDRLHNYFLENSDS